MLEEDLRATKEAWAARLAEERKGWQVRLAEKVTVLQGEMDVARETHAAKAAGLEAELAAVLEARRRVEEELDVTRNLLHEETRKRRTLQAELGELKSKYQRCMELAQELLALRNSGKKSLPPPPPQMTATASCPTATTTTATTTTHPSAFRSASTSRLGVEDSSLFKVGRGLWLVWALWYEHDWPTDRINAFPT